MDSERRETVYIETTVVSYLAARPSRDIVIAAHQELTREWWRDRNRFRLFVSEAVVEEAGRGDSNAAARRMNLVSEISSLRVDSSARDLAQDLLSEGVMEASAVVDAVHVAIAAAHGIDYLLTWNLKHIAGAAVRCKIEQRCRARGFVPPTICTPEELLER